MMRAACVLICACAIAFSSAAEVVVEEQSATCDDATDTDFQDLLSKDTGTVFKRDIIPKDEIKRLHLRFHVHTLSN